MALMALIVGDLPGVNRERFEFLFLLLQEFNMSMNELMYF